MKKFIVVLFVLTFFLPTSTAYAGYVMDSNGKYVLSEDSYTEDGKIKVTSILEKYGDPDMVYNSEIDKFDKSLSKLPGLVFGGADDKTVTGTVLYPNRNDVKLGDFDLQWVFTPDDAKYESRTGVFHFYIWPEDSEASKGKLPDPEPEQPTAPSLTATTVQLTTLTAYDINLDKKVSGSSYSWTSSDTSIVDVNPRSGLLKAKKEGTATVTCDIAYPDGSQSSLSSIVTVGFDENAPLLTETSLDLETGDVFDINLENKVAKSKYRWVTSDKTIASVNSSNGKVTAVSEGVAFVTCTITTPDKQVIVLRCDISVTAPKAVTE
jgi:hypothetical protein